MSVIFINQDCNAQPFTKGLPLGGWHIASVRWGLSDKWSLTTEAQTRSARVESRFFYHEFKGGAGYQLNPTVQTFLGLGNYTTYDPDQSESFAGCRLNEWRLWEQLIFKNKFPRVRMEQRFRFEQRFFNNSTYRNRARYRINITIPVNHLDLKKTTLFLNAYNEIFLNNRPPHFERNRLYMGGGYEFSKQWTFMAGLIGQYDYSLNSRLNRNFIQTTVLFSFSSFSSDRENVPTTID